MNVKPDSLAIVVQGMWPNVGRIVYVGRRDPAIDFTAMGLGHCTPDDDRWSAHDRLHAGRLIQAAGRFTATAA